MIKIGLSETSAMVELTTVRERLRADVAREYEHRAASCATCSTPGACCLDAHFVNVRVTRLEAAAIRKVIDRLPDNVRDMVDERIDDAIERFGLERNTDAGDKTYACPLYEKGSGCLVHDEAKPLPCIFHACYSRPADLPPDELLDDAEAAVADLNRRAYGSLPPTLPIPIAIAR